MKKFFFIIAFITLSIYAMAQNKKVAVYVTGDDPVNNIVANRLVDGLARNGKYTAVERTSSFLDALSKEHKYERDGSVDDNEIAKLGRQFSVQYVCVASALDVWNNEKYITAHIIDVETAQVIASSSSNGSVTNGSELIRALNSLSDSFLEALNMNTYTGTKKVAIYVTRTGNRDVDIILGDQLVAGFTRSGKYVAIERTKSFLTQLSKEQGYQYSGAVDDDDLTRLGKQFGVQYVCVAKTTSWAGDYFISTRLIDVASAEVVNTYNVEGIKLYNSQSVVTMASEIAERLSGRTIKEEEEFQKAEAQRREQERLEQERRRREEEQRRQEEAERAERARVQALINRPWRDLLLTKVTKNVTKRYDSGNCYIGKKPNGMVMYVWNDGTVYCGNYDSDNLKTGTGMFICAEGYHPSNCPGGMYYVGPWWNGDKQDDGGTIYNENGKLIYYGKFKHDKPKDQYPSSASLQSLYSSYTFEVINYNNGDKYVGECLNGKKHGQGLYIWESGSAWYGKWENDARNGYGIYMPYEGGYNTGTWKNDSKVY